MYTIEKLNEEKDLALAKAKELREYIDSAAFYAPGVSEFERMCIKGQEEAMLRYHAELISLIELKTLPI